MRSLELFAGAGGLALGISKAGFEHLGVVEWDHDACETIRENQKRGSSHVNGWPVFEGDVSDFNFKEIKDSVDLLAGGPPCQPFSLGGKHRGHKDNRNMFPEVFRAVRTLAPKAVILENVKGLTRSSFAPYLEYILAQLAFPEIILKDNEEWQEHSGRISAFKASKKSRGLEYDVHLKLVNSANYGVPQKRERVIMVAFRKDLKIQWAYPSETHSRDRLIWDQWVTGEYWERHKVAKKDRPKIPAKFLTRAELLKSSCLRPENLAWKTVRDALFGLPDPEKGPNLNGTLNHVFNPGARSYPGHTGSPLDEPAKTLKAGDHGVPGGENMLARPDGSVRYFTVRESARLQTFPDDYIFMGAWSEAMRQLGNAVPMDLGKVFAKEVRSKLALAVKDGRKIQGMERTFDEERITL